MVTKGGLEAYRWDVPDACMRVLDSCHFVTDSGVDESSVLPQNVASDSAPALVEKADDDLREYSGASAAHA